MVGMQTHFCLLENAEQYGGCQTKPMQSYSNHCGFMHASNAASKRYESKEIWATLLQDVEQLLVAWPLFKFILLIALGSCKSYNKYIYT